MRRLFCSLIIFCCPLLAEIVPAQEIPNKNPLKVMTSTLKERKTMKVRLKKWTRRHINL